jgi:hypothetical protein
LDHWGVESKLGDGWVSPNKKNYKYIFIILDFSVNPPEGRNVSNLELELELDAEGRNNELYIYSISPKLDERFGLLPASSYDPSNNQLSFSGKVSSTIGYPQVEVGMTIPVNKSNSKAIGHITKIGKRHFAYWHFNSNPCGFDDVSLIVGVTADTPTIRAKLRTSAVVTYKHVLFRHISIMNEIDKGESDYTISLIDYT